MESPAEFSQRRRFLGVPKSWLPWLCLAAALILYLAYLRALGLQAYFGRYGDDAVYFSSAKALAEGRGYVIASLPGSPPQTKYPVLYPWLLSLVWRLRPSFPANLVPALWMMACFACWFLVASFQLLRKLTGVGDWLALVMVTLCAFESNFLFISGSLLSELPYIALALTAAVVADDAVRATGSLRLAAAAGCLAGLSVMVRSIGVAVLAGILAAALFRRAFRQGALVCLGSAPFVLASFWGSRTPAGLAERLACGAAGALPGWHQTFLHYTSYPDFWRLSVPRLGVFEQMVVGHFLVLLQGPSLYILEPTLAIGRSILAYTLGALVTAAVAVGIVRQARSQEWKPIHFIFVFYAGVILVWNYLTLDRFLLLFLPLFYAGLWLEGKRLIGMLLASLRPGRPASEKILGGLMLAGVAILAGVVAWNYWHYRPPLAGVGGRRASLIRDKAEAYQWIRQHTDPAARVVASEDASVYLYTGRQAVAPLVFSTEYATTGDKEVLDRELDRLTDTATALRARYWLVSEDDFQLQPESIQAPAQERVARLMSPLPEVYHSRDERVRLYDISRMLPPAPEGCQAGGAAPALPQPHE